MKILFFGCGAYARPALRALVEGGFPPALVITKPDSPRGRGRRIYEQEVKLEADELKLPCRQPADPHDPSFLDELRQLDAAVGVVISYGVILQPDLYELPEHGCINAHASILPAYRGAAPIEFAIKDGCPETGITVMRIARDLDTGDIQRIDRTPIGDRETAGQLRERLAELSGKSLCTALEELRDGRAEFTPQDETKASHAPKIEKAHGAIDWNTTAVDVDRLVRAMTPKPGAQTRLGAKRFIVMEGEVEQDLFGIGVPGVIQSGGEEGIRVCTGHDLFRITRIKPDNGRNMTAGEFVRGHPLPPDARFT